MVKNVKRIMAFALLMLMLPACALAGVMVRDDAQLFTADEIAQMETIIQRIRDNHGMDAAVLTSHEAGSNDTQDFADLYYENGGYGLDGEQSGFVYFIDMNNRVPCISTTGSAMGYLHNDRLEEVLDLSYEWLVKGEYGQSAIAVLNRMESYFQQGRSEGTYFYDAETGERLSGEYNELTAAEILVAAAAGLGVAAIVAGSVSASYNLKNGSGESVSAHAQRVLTRDDERFLRESVSRVRNAPPPSSSGSSGGGSGVRVHHSSSGRSHGGGVGRKF